MGKKLKFTEAEFARMSREYIDSVRFRRSLVDASGEVMLNALGQEMFEYVYPVPPSIAGWALYLGMSKRTLTTHYRARYPEVYERTRTELEAYNVRELLSRKTGAEPVKFNLQSNYGWRDTRSESAAARAETAPKPPSGPSLSEKVEMCRGMGEE